MNWSQNWRESIFFIEEDIAVPFFENFENFFSTSGLLCRLKQEMSSHRDGEGVAGQGGGGYLQKNKTILRPVS